MSKVQSVSQKKPALLLLRGRRKPLHVANKHARTARNIKAQSLQRNLLVHVRNQDYSTTLMLCNHFPAHRFVGLLNHSFLFFFRQYLFSIWTAPHLAKARSWTPRGRSRCCAESIEWLQSAPSPKASQVAWPNFLFEPLQDCFGAMECFGSAVAAAFQRCCQSGSRASPKALSRMESQVWWPTTARGSKWGERKLRRHWRRRRSAGVCLLGCKKKWNQDEKEKQETGDWGCERSRYCYSTIWSSSVKQDVKLPISKQANGDAEFFFTC